MYEKYPAQSPDSISKPLLFQKSSSKRKQQRLHPCNKTVIREHEKKKKSKIRQPKVKTCESPSSDTCEPSTPHLITGSFTSKTCAVYLYHRKYLHSTSSASSETGRLPKHVFNIFFFCINSAIGTRYFH